MAGHREVPRGEQHADNEPREEPEAHRNPGVDVYAVNGGDERARRKGDEDDRADDDADLFEAIGESDGLR